MSASEQTSASKLPIGFYWIRYNTKWTIGFCDGDGFESFSRGPDEIDPRRIERHQPPDMTLDNPNLEQLIKAMFPAQNYGTTNKQKVANATSTAGQPDECPQCNGNGGGFTDNGWEACQPDELSRAEARIRELEKLIGSESVYTLLRYGFKNPGSSGVDDCEEERHYMELYNISKELRSKKP